VADWKQQAIAQLPQIRTGINYIDPNGNDPRPAYLDAVGKAVVAAFATQSSHLKIHDMAATSLPPSVWNLKGLKELDLDFNQALTELPEKIANLQQLTKLSAAGTSLESLPTSIGGLPKLATLHLGGGSYESLPLGFTRLGSSLQDLDISHSRPGPGGTGGLKELPHMGEFKLLQNLKISDHRELAEVPASLGDLTQLRTLDLSYCPKLTSIPDLSKLQNLETLNLRGCTGLSARPEWLNQLPRGCKVSLPTHLTSRRRAPETARRTEASPPRTAEETAQRQQKLEGWTNQLQPFKNKGEHGAGRFNLWMGAMVGKSYQDKGRETADMDKMNALVEAAAASPDFRAKLFEFAAANVQVPRSRLGRQQTDRATIIDHTVGIGDAHNLLIEHRVSDPRQMSAAQAYGTLQHLMAEQENFAQAVVSLAASRPRPGAAGSQAARVPPILAAYVRTHDPVGSALMEEQRKLSPADAAAGTAALQEALHHRHVAVAKQLVAVYVPSPDSPSSSAPPRR
jgi:hypothetical protein